MLKISNQSLHKNHNLERKQVKCIQPTQMIECARQIWLSIYFYAFFKKKIFFFLNQELSSKFKRNVFLFLQFRDRGFGAGFCCVCWKGLILCSDCTLQVRLVTKQYRFSIYFFLNTERKEERRRAGWWNMHFCVLLS